MDYRYIRCPRCGLSNGKDDVILSNEVIDKSHDGSELTILEERKCDVCQKVYKVKMYYALKYEEIRL